MKKSTIITTVIGVLIVTIAVTAGTYTNDKMMEKIASKMESGMEGSDAVKDTYALKFLSGISYNPGQSSLLEFTVIDKDGRRLNQNDYKVEHEKRMHVIVVSRDLSQFQHVHPVFDTESHSYKLPDFVFPSAGEYRIFTDFAINTHGDTMPKHSDVQYQDVFVGNAANFQAQPLGQPTTGMTIDGNTINLTVKPTDSNTKKILDFTITRGGQKVTDLENYLGALGHLVVLRHGDLAYIHTHALTTDTANQNGTVSFEVDFVKPGSYKAFGQFQRDGKIFTTSFVIDINKA